MPLNLQTLPLHLLWHFHYHYFWHAIKLTGTATTLTLALSLPLLLACHYNATSTATNSYMPLHCHCPCLQFLHATTLPLPLPPILTCHYTATATATNSDTPLTPNTNSCLMLATCGAVTLISTCVVSTRGIASSLYSTSTLVFSSLTSSYQPRTQSASDTCCANCFPLNNPSCLPAKPELARFVLAGSDIEEGFSLVGSNLEGGV